MNQNVELRIQEIEENASNLLSGMASAGKEIPEDFFYKAVKKSTEDILEFNSDVSNEDIPIEIIVRRLQERFSISMSLGTMIVDAEKYIPWVKDASADIDWYYWNRYKKELKTNNFPPDVVNKLSEITETILDHTENPKKDGGWDRRGMVVGYVQSGKTANYTGVIARAADAGYKVIIILAGSLNALRNQTQERIDQGFIGKCTKLKKFIGVGLHDQARTPAYFTTSISDFKKSVATQIGVQLDSISEPVVFVVKKNTSTLKNLSSWLRDNNPHKLNEFPMLLIDDEADHASVNTKKDGITAINSRIRELLSLFSQSTYIGYTATPFANIFIDPDVVDDVFEDDLFPRDFILSLDPPTNYQGPQAIFKDDINESPVRIIMDYENAYPRGHKKDYIPSHIPQSLKNALNSFIISKAIRIIRRQSKHHHSMMINITRFTNVQSNIKSQLYSFLENDIKPAIRNYSSLSPEEALTNNIIRSIYETWTEEYSDCKEKWNDIQQLLHKSVSPIEIIEVNSSKSAEPLNYNNYDYPNGRTLIAVGGLSLSRGLTLEGLCITYFLRNSIMYDTLLQMGRWFGYRDGYGDLCKIYMTQEAYGWYYHISSVIEELRDDFIRMNKLRMTPNDFGLAVRSHPESLIVTAQSKMRSGTNVIREIDLGGRLVETRTLTTVPSVIRLNRINMEKFICDINKTYSLNPKNTTANYLWENVNASYIQDFIDSIQNHPESGLTEKGPILEYIKWLENNEHEDWDVILYNIKKGKSNFPPIYIGELEINFESRKVINTGTAISFPNRKIAPEGSEKVGLTPSQLERAKSLSTNNNPTDKHYRMARNKPLLMLHLLDCHSNNEPDKPLFKNGIIGWGLSFPGTSTPGRAKKLVEYIVNVRYYEQTYGADIEEETEEEEENE